MIKREQQTIVLFMCWEEIMQNCQFIEPCCHPVDNIGIDGLVILYYPKFVSTIS